MKVFNHNSPNNVREVEDALKLDNGKLIKNLLDLVHSFLEGITTTITQEMN